jgi:hypothetical protein
MKRAQVAVVRPSTGSRTTNLWLLCARPHGSTLSRRALACCVRTANEDGAASSDD